MGINFLHKSMQLTVILIQMYQVHILATYSLKFCLILSSNLCLDLPVCQFMSGFEQSSEYISHLSILPILLSPLTTLIFLKFYTKSCFMKFMLHYKSLSVLNTLSNKPLQFLMNVIFKNIKFIFML